MSASDVSVVVAASIVGVTALVLVVVCVVLTRRIAELRRLTASLHAETLPLLRQARAAADQAATELERVGDVLGSAEAVSATVDSASRLAYRAFSNPVVKTAAYATGLRGALRRLFTRSVSPRREPAPASTRRLGDDAEVA